MDPLGPIVDVDWRIPSQRNSRERHSCAEGGRSPAKVGMKNLRAKRVLGSSFHRGRN